jgi:hypothetical protein
VLFVSEPPSDTPLHAKKWVRRAVRFTVRRGVPSLPSGAERIKVKSVVSLSAGALALAIAASSNAALVYGGGTETGSRHNPGVGAITYMNCFTAVGAGQNQLALESAIVGIRRIAFSLDVGLNIYAAEMTYDGTNFGRGANYLIYSTATLGASPSESVTQLVSSGDVTSQNVVLNLELASNAGLGGWWIGVEFTGVNAGNVNHGWRGVNAPTTGASINGFGVFNNAGSGVFQSFFAFGIPPGSEASRMMVDVNGTLVPAPGALALLGVAGLVARRRR